MPTAALIYPHQLYEAHPAVADADVVFLVEDPLFFRQYAFHKQKLMLHRASMKGYAHQVLPQAGYINAHQLTHTGDVVGFVKQAKCDAVQIVDPNDDSLGFALRACTRLPSEMSDSEDSA